MLDFIHSWIPASATRMLLEGRLRWSNVPVKAFFATWSFNNVLANLPCILSRTATALRVADPSSDAKLLSTCKFNLGVNERLPVLDVPSFMTILFNLNYNRLMPHTRIFAKKLSLMTL